MASVLFFNLIIMSFVFLLWGSNLSEGPKRGLVKLIGTLLMGAAFICSGIVTLIMIRTSPSIEISGQIQNLVERHGKNSSSKFDIMAPMRGQSIRVNSRYVGDHFKNGETVIAKVLLYQNTLLSLRVVDGPYSNWEHQEGDGSLGAWLGVAFGSLFVVGGIRKWKLAPNAPEPPDYRTPKDGIDEQSLLRLNRD